MKVESDKQPQERWTAKDWWDFLLAVGLIAWFVLICNYGSAPAYPV